MPLEYRLTGVSRNFSTPAKVNDLVELSSNLLPGHAENRAVEEDVFSSRSAPDESPFPLRANSPRVHEYARDLRSVSLSG